MGKDWVKTAQTYSLKLLVFSFLQIKKIHIHIQIHIHEYCDTVNSYSQYHSILTIFSYFSTVCFFLVK